MVSGPRAHGDSRRETQVITIGIVLLLVAWLLPDVLPGVEPGILHVCHVLGVIAVVVGLILLVFGHFRGPVRGRRYWW
jgi:hypothetical protein